jgi:hypothetical protein
MERPIIVFVGQTNEILYERLEKISQDYNVPFENIQKTSHALQARKIHAESSSGIFCLNRKFSMGLDLKLKKEALVIIYGNDPKM